ncbi:hypothetical protein Pint_02917 [Pistacia integerrima]|uniref:Uncharacterized protein n=1 Tax=Pistacia integerrima TaxID=434235 RepID=A0ACC0ZI52_9ROSI|nr:hypothetical protein Pint_02917 [Pistacia integerrima]
MRMGEVVLSSEEAMEMELETEKNETKKDGSFEAVRWERFKLLVDFDLDCEGIGYPCQPTVDTCASVDNISGSSHESGDANLEADQVVSEYSSTLTEVLSGKDMNVEGSETLTAVKSITKCIRILSPAKGRRSSLD